MQFCGFMWDQRRNENLKWMKMFKSFLKAQGGFDIFSTKLWNYLAMALNVAIFNILSRQMKFIFNSFAEISFQEKANILQKEKMLWTYFSSGIKAMRFCCFVCMCFLFVAVKWKLGKWKIIMHHAPNLSWEQEHYDKLPNRCNYMQIQLWGSFSCHCSHICCIMHARECKIRCNYGAFVETRSFLTDEQEMLRMRFINIRGSLQRENYVLISRFHFNEVVRRCKHWEIVMKMVSWTSQCVRSRIKSRELQHFMQIKDSNFAFFVFVSTLKLKELVNIWCVGISFSLNLFHFMWKRIYSSSCEHIFRTFLFKLCSVMCWCRRRWCLVCENRAQKFTKALEKFNRLESFAENFSV